jgi:hypothetical protein
LSSNFARPTSTLRGDCLGWPFSKSFVTSSLSSWKTQRQDTAHLRRARLFKTPCIWFSVAWALYKRPMPIRRSLTCSTTWMESKDVEAKWQHDSKISSSTSCATSLTSTWPIQAQT